MTRAALLVVHTGRDAAVLAAVDVAAMLATAGVEVFVPPEEVADLAAAGPSVHWHPAADAVPGLEFVVAVGGDGTLLRAAEYARPAQAPLIGINLGRIGFLAEADRSDLDATVERLLAHAYDIEERQTLDVEVLRAGTVAHRMWALNDVSVEKTARERMLELLLEVDGRPLSRYGGDGVVCATPTGSTAYAFSAGGPVVWPAVQALLVVPLSAHALFARPLVVGPQSVVAVELVDEHARAGVWCDGRRSHDLSPLDRIEVRQGSRPVLLARLSNAPFTDRLVEKFRLPVDGWRGRGDED